MSEYTLKELISLKHEIGKSNLSKSQTKIEKKNEFPQIFDLTEIMNYDFSLMTAQPTIQQKATKKMENPFEKYGNKEMWNKVEQSSHEGKRIEFPEIGLERTPFHQKYSMKAKEFKKVSEKKKFLDNLNAVHKILI